MRFLASFWLVHIAMVSISRSMGKQLTCEDGPMATIVFQGPSETGLGSAFEEDMDVPAESGVCRVLVSQQAEGFADYDYVLTDSLPSVGFLGRSGALNFLDGASWRLEDAGEAMNQKSRTLSILFPPQDVWDGLTEAIFAEAVSLGQAVFLDDGRAETHDAAFRGARFAWIIEARNESIHPAYVRALGHHAIPIFSGWVLFTNMFHNAVIRYPLKRGAVADLLWQLRLMLGSHEDITMAKYHHTILDILVYRYRVPLAERLRTAACILCRPRTSFVFVGVYSALRNFDKRAAIRETWGRVLAQYGIPVQFFLGEPMDPASSENADLAEAEAHAIEEAEAFGDVVRLPVPEGYTNNARKGLAFLRYIGENHGDAAFCIKVDDDVYWRPEALLRMLRHRTPFRYIWGFLDLNSPVPREERDSFFHSVDEWPDDIFPPYPRGVLRALSMDIVRLVSASHSSLHMGVTGDDPSLGVHLRQLVMQGGTFLQMDDRGANSRFAMEPTCRTEGVYCPLKETTWIVHHVSRRAIKCMYRADVRAGYYRWRKDGTLRTAQAETFPSLCKCVDGKWARRQGRRRRRLRLERTPSTQCPRPAEGGIRV